MRQILNQILESIEAGDRPIDAIAAAARESGRPIEEIAGLWVRAKIMGKVPR